MKIAVISDIHGNDVALEAVLADLRGAGWDEGDPLVCLGDAIQGGPQPAEVVARLRDLACPVVMGNADAWLLTGEETGDEAISDSRRQQMDAVRAWSLSRLSEADRAFIAGFQPTVTLSLDGDRRLLCFHGSPHSFDDVILPTTAEADFTALLTPFLPAIQTGGHTHMQQIRRIGRSADFFFNPGSVGLAYSHQQPDTAFYADPWAEYAVLSTAQGTVRLELRRVPFDVGALRACYQMSGRPHAAEALAQYPV